MTLLAIVWFTFWAVLIFHACRIRNSKFRQWAERDAALCQAFNDYLARGEIEEAREIRRAIQENYREYINKP